MYLTKTIPERRKTVNFLWCHKDWFEMNETFRSIRSSRKEKYDKCFWCEHPFDDGEKMSIAAPTEGKNRMLCGDCANTLLDSEE